MSKMEAATQEATLPTYSCGCCGESLEVTQPVADWIETPLLGAIERLIRIYELRCEPCLARGCATTHVGKCIRELDREREIRRRQALEAGAAVEPVEASPDFAEQVMAKIASLPPPGPMKRRPRPQPAGRRYQGRAPFGYRRVYHTEPECNSVEIDEAEAAIVRWFFSSYLRARSLKALREACERYGVANRRGQVFSAAGLAYMLKNTVYLGRDELPRIVSDIIFNKVQRRLQCGDKRVGRGRRRGIAVPIEPPPGYRHDHHR